MYYHNTNSNMNRSLLGKLHSKTPQSVQNAKEANEVWQADPDIKWKTATVSSASQEIKNTLSAKNRALLREADAQGKLMLWFRIMIYALLFIMAAVCFANAVLIITGAHYPESIKATLKAELSGLGAMDAGFAAANIIAGFLIIFARFRAASFKRGSNTLLFVATLLAAVVMAAAGAAFNLYAAEYLSQLEAIRPSLDVIVPFIVISFVNFVYLKRRKELFVH